MSVAPSASAKARRGADPLSGFGRQTLAWQACGTFQCATLTVPQDYSNPTGPLFHLPVVKSPATDPAHRVGTLFVDPGGPAASGVAFVQQQPSVFSATLQSRFDIVSWDRRGSAGSDPALHCLGDSDLDAYNHLDPASPDTNALMRAGASYAAACRTASAAGLTSNSGTLQTALDTDVLRSALGEQQISYLGFSYGTFQGSWYAQLFPTHLRSIVLDGMFDPSLTGEQTLVGESAGFERELRYYENSCTTSGGVPCPEPTPAAMSSLIDGLTAQVRTKPLAVPGSARTVGPAELAAAFTFLGVAPEVTWGLANYALTQAAGGDGTTLLTMADAWNGRNADGTHDGTAIDGTDLWCSDRPWSQSAADWADLRSAAEAAGPHVGALRAEQALPCTAWNPPSLMAAPLTAAGAPPIVVVSTTGDPATPYQWGVHAAQTFAHGVLVTYQGHGHTAYGRSNACVTTAVDDDLIDGTPPANGTVC
jgi:pimeloyl-ACP methyl ester carboxylesterase